MRGVRGFGPVPAGVVFNGESFVEREDRGVKYLSCQKEVPGGSVEIRVFDGKITGKKISALVEVRDRDGLGNYYIQARIINLGGMPIYTLHLGPPDPKVDCRMPSLEFFREGQEIQIGFK
ncbi:MAG: hypothetical protein WC120_01200 [Parcubacteria group bacterium]